MKYSLRSLMIVAVLGPPILAGAWTAGAKAIAEYRERQQNQDEWTDVGGPGTVAAFTTGGCMMDEDDSSVLDGELAITSDGDAP